MDINIKIIFVDIDWTILNHGVSPMRFDLESIEALKEAQKRGIKVFLCTARPFHSVEQISLFNIFSPDGMILCNGGLVIIDDKIAYENVIIQEDFEKLCEVVISKGYTLEASEPFSRFLIAPKTEYVDELFNTYHEEVPDVKDYHNRHVITSMLFAPPEIDEEMIRDIPPSLHYYRFHHAGVDIVSNPNNKGDSVRRVLELLNIKKEEAAAFGDDVGDISMFEEVKYGIAVGNAKDELKEVAFYVSENIDNHAIKCALKHFGII